MQLILHITRHCPSSAAEIRPLLVKTHSPNILEDLDSLDFPTCSFPIGDDWMLTVPLIVECLPPDAVAFWVTETPDGNEVNRAQKKCVPRHWIISDRNPMTFGPELLSDGHGRILGDVAKVTGATHVGRFKIRATPTLFCPDERIVWPRARGWDVCDLDGNVTETVPAAA